MIHKTLFMLMTYVISISENETNLFFGCENQKRDKKAQGVTLDINIRTFVRYLTSLHF
jgi:hypothetical protein